MQQEKNAKVKTIRDYVKNVWQGSGVYAITDSDGTRTIFARFPRSWKTGGTGIDCQATERFPVPAGPVAGIGPAHDVSDKAA